MEENKTIETPETSEETSVNVSPLLAEFQEEPIAESLEEEIKQPEPVSESPVVTSEEPATPVIEAPVANEEVTPAVEPVIEKPVVSDPNEEAYVASPQIPVAEPEEPSEPVIEPAVVEQAPEETPAPVIEAPVVNEIAQPSITNDEASEPTQEEKPMASEETNVPAQEPAEPTPAPAESEVALVVDESTIAEKPQEVVEEKKKEPSKVAQIVGTIVVLLITAFLAYLIIRNFLLLN